MQQPQQAQHQQVTKVLQLLEDQVFNLFYLILKINNLQNFYKSLIIKYLRKFQDTENQIVAKLLNL
jgi:hypothetical protein